MTGNQNTQNTFCYFKTAQLDKCNLNTFVVQLFSEYWISESNIADFLGNTRLIPLTMRYVLSTEIGNDLYVN